MENALLALSLLSCIALIVSVLLQRSEGGALGMGGGGGGGLVSGRGAADTLVKATMFLAAVFIVTCLALTRITYENSKDSSEVTQTLEEAGGSLVDEVLGETTETAPLVSEPADLISEALSAEETTTSENVSDEAESQENTTPNPENQ